MNHLNYPVTIMSYKSVTCQTEKQSLGFFSSFVFDHSNHTHWKMKSSRRQGVDYYAKIAYLKKRNLGCTVIDLVMKIKPFKGVNLKFPVEKRITLFISYVQLHHE